MFQVKYVVKVDIRDTVVACRFNRIKPCEKSRFVSYSQGLLFNIQISEIFWSSGLVLFYFDHL
jgi:hypothetical protein